MKIAAALTLLLITSGCGGVGKMSDLPASTPAFINQTGLSDADFQAMANAKWAEAQQQTATQYVDLWANWRTLNNQPAAPACFTGAIKCDGIDPPDPRALNVAPRGVDVASVPDIAVGLNTAGLTDPTGVIPCGPGGTLRCDAYLNWPPCDIFVPTSRPDYMGPYEMQNCILIELGYDTSRR